MADATVVNTPAQDSGAAGWAVAVLILLAVVAGGFVWYRYYGSSNTGAPAPSTTNINVTVPTPAPGSGSTGGSTNP